MSEKLFSFCLHVECRALFESLHGGELNQFKPLVYLYKKKIIFRSNNVHCMQANERIIFRNAKEFGLFEIKFHLRNLSYLNVN